MIGGVRLSVAWFDLTQERKSLGSPTLTGWKAMTLATRVLIIIIINNNNNHFATFASTNLLVVHNRDSEVHFLFIVLVSS